MYDLAKVLGVKLVFVHYDFPTLIDDIKTNKFDIAIGSIYVVPNRLLHVAYTQPYFKDRPAFIVKKSKTNEFKTLKLINEIKNIKISVFNDPVMVPIAKQNFPDKELVIIPNVDILVNSPEIYASLWTQKHADAWASAHPGYASVVTYGLKNASPLLIAYMLPKNEKEFLWFLDYWLKIEETNGFKQEQYNQWLLGQPRVTEKAHWSLLQLLLRK